MQNQNNLNDLRIRIILIPLFGLIIPNAAGLINNNLYSFSELIFCYFYFIFISFAIWQGNRFFLFKLRYKISWLNTPVKKILLLLLSNIIYTIPLTIFLLLLWYNFSNEEIINWQAIINASLMCIICVIFITHVYETVFLLKQWENDKLKSERLQKAKAQAELEALKSQIDPHFIFNSLNTLSLLIENDKEKAALFNDNLADVYRYILSNKDKELVILSDEISFLQNYFLLLKIRFEDAVKIDIQIREELFDKYLIPPTSLQLLLENAVKHNAFSEKNPLILDIKLIESHIIVENKVSLKETGRTSSKIGLMNLNERYKLITEKEIEINRFNGTFSVNLPIIKI